MFYRDERLALFLDGANLHATARGLGMELDYKLLRAEFARRGKLLRASYYTALLDSEEYSPVRPLVDWLQYNGYTVVTKPAREYTDAAGRRRVRGSMSVELAVDLVQTAGQVDHLVLFSGDGDFRASVEAAQRGGARVSVVSSIRSQGASASDDLRRQADNFIELEDLRDVIARPPRPDEAA
ncbi:MAG: LabA-like NYN domain-containing protein [Paracoccaceae bacterium]